MDIFKFPVTPNVQLADRKAKKFGESEGTPVGYDWVVSTTEDFIEEMNKNISYARDIISKQAVINKDKHPDITSAISEGWDNPALIPYSLYENLADSQLASHKFIRELILDVSRSIVGDNSIDVLDYFKCLRTEAKSFLGFVKKYPDMQVAQVEPCVYYASRLWASFNRMSLLSYSSSISALETAISDTSTVLDQQKKIHSFIIKTNKIISADKALLSNITIESSDKYFSEKLPSQMIQGNFVIDAKEMFKKRINAIEEISNDIQDSISAVNSMRSYHSELGESPDGVAPEDVTAGFIVQSDPVGIAAANNDSQVIRNNIEAPANYFPSMIFTATEQLSAYEIIDMLNNLPATHTYIRAGIISVAAEWSFINELIENINNQPDNSTLISGGLISLKGTSLDSWGDAVDVSLEELYNTAYVTASGMIEMMNDYTEGGGLSVLLPGLIGLKGDTPGGIRDAIIDKLNETTTSSGEVTLIGPGAILVHGADTLEDKYPTWDNSAASGDVSGTVGLVNYWSLSDSTLIDGSTIAAGTVSLDKLVVGLSAIYTNPTQVSYAQSGSGDIDIGSIQSIQEMRLGGPSFWPANSEYFKYKILLRTANGESWTWFRGGVSNWATSNRYSVSGTDSTTSQPFAIIPFLGSQTKEIRFIFDSFYDNVDAQISASLIAPSGGLIVYGGTGLWDGSGIYANSITIGSMEQDVQTTIINADTVITNFDNRNDRINTLPIAPVVAPSAVSHSINTDGSCDIYFRWSF